MSESTMRRLGQHFLSSPAALRAIAGAVEPRPGETIIEIGAGHGELTAELQRANGKWQIIAIEKDARLAEFLRKRFAAQKNIEVVERDALVVLPQIVADHKPRRKVGIPAAASELKATSFSVAGNIPYYLTGRLLRTIGELDPRPSRCVFTLQKEVAERICAAPPRMNRLAAIVQFWAKPTIVQTISSTAFRPPPKVHSAVLRLETLPRPRTIDPAAYFAVVRAIFRQPRQTAENNLSRLLGSKTRAAEALEKAGIAPGARPQDIGIPSLVRLACLCKIANRGANGMAYNGSAPA